jgi:ABC-type amino acid transport substrate-binding protein
VRQLPASVQPRPEFVDELHDELTARLGFVTAPADGVRGERVGQRPSGPRGAWLLIAATMATMLTLAGGVVAGALFVNRLPTPPSLLDEVRSRETLRVAVRPDNPQVRSPGGALGGFDMSVARALGQELGFRVEFVVIPVDEMLAEGASAWDVAMPSAAEPATMDRFVSSQPYYSWPVYVLVPTSSSAERADDLDGRSVCAVTGSPGEAWLEDDIAQPPALVAAPDNITLVTGPDDDACLARVAEGDAEAMVTAAWTRADIASRSGYRVLQETEVAFEPRSIVARTDGPDPTELLVALDDAMRALRADGTLTDLARQHFGGEDLSDVSR